jgi:hypothetical protein
MEMPPVEVGVSREDLLKAISEIFTGIDQEVPPSVFEFRVNRLEWVTKPEGKDCTK